MRRFQHVDIEIESGKVCGGVVPSAIHEQESQLFPDIEVAVYGKGFTLVERI